MATGAFTAAIASTAALAGPSAAGLVGGALAVAMLPPQSLTNVVGLRLYEELVIDGRAHRVYAATVQQHEMKSELSGVANEPCARPRFLRVAERAKRRKKMRHFVWRWRAYARCSASKARRAGGTSPRGAAATRAERAPRISDAAACKRLVVDDDGRCGELDGLLHRYDDGELNKRSLRVKLKNLVGKEAVQEALSTLRQQEPP